MSAASPRETGEDLLHELFLGLPPASGVSEGRMFNGYGLRVEAGFFAFIGSEGRLVVKVSVAEVQRWVAAGEAEPVTMGTRTMREWVSLTMPDDNTSSEPWRGALADSLAFVTT